MTVCPLCDRDEANLDGVYGVHYDKAGVLRCPNSGQPVVEPVEPVKKAPRKKSSAKK